jgi:geranylgeranyl diphosphate synthase type I
VWSDELLAAAPLSDAQREAIEPVIRMMRSEAIFGQYLDLLATGRQDGDVDATLTVARYKTGSYTVHRPLQLGAVLAGAGPEVLPACRAVGVPLGEAFQLRDDLLGVFGDPARTGKSRLDDLREGKHTTLMALALQRADPEQARRLRRLVGDPELGEAGASAVREILEGTGARDEVERMIRTRYEKARAALRDAPFAPAGSAALAGLASRAVVRDS